MKTLSNKRIVVGVTGGIAAYKAPDLVRRLRDAGAQVRVAMTPAAREFITPLTLQAVSGQAVHEALLDVHAESGMGHIELARWADALVIAPASADFMARLAAGMANDLVSTICIATDAPVLLAPSMNRQMWMHPATQRNLRTLEADGVERVGPGSGDQACGENGEGRMSEPLEIVAATAALFRSEQMHGRRVVVTAGPTFEPVDPVRGITNHSSGKMGFAIADAAARAGARVTLIAGPVAGLATPPGVEQRIDVQSASDMYRATHAALDSETADVFVGVAAVADYRPADVQPQKIKKSADTLSIEMVRNPDIIASVAQRPDRPFVVGFAAETNDVIANARLKLVSKGLDMVAANQVGGDRGGFARDENALSLVERSSITEFPLGPKTTLARQLIELIANRLENPDQHAQDNTAQDSR